MISGDNIVSSIEDNYNDLCLAAIESINGFSKKTGKDFEQMFEEKLFDQYTKTCLWTAKARRGNKIKKGYAFNNNKVSIEEHKEFLDLNCSSQSCDALDMSDKVKKMSPATNEIFGVVIKNPAVLTSSGRINVKKLATLSSLPMTFLREKVRELEEYFNE